MYKRQHATRAGTHTADCWSSYARQTTIDACLTICLPRECNGASSTSLSLLVAGALALAFGAL